MQTITLNIKNPQIESYLQKISQTKNKTIEIIIQEIIFQYFEHNFSESSNQLPLSLFYDLIKQSEVEYETDKITEHSDFENETLLW